MTVQQASLKSTDYETYQPYLNEIVNYIKRCVPKAKIAIHQTWAYEQDSQMLNEKGYSEHTKMFEDVKGSYQKGFDEEISEQEIKTVKQILTHLIKEEIL